MVVFINKAVDSVTQNLGNSIVYIWFEDVVYKESWYENDPFCMGGISKIVNATID